MPLGRQSHDDPCFKTFTSKLHEFTVRPKSHKHWNGRPFVLVDRLEGWLRSQAETGSGENGEILLESVYKTLNVQPIDYAQMKEGSSKCLLTFCILLEMRHGYLLYAFYRSGRIVDRLLPMNLYSLQREIEECLKGQSFEYSAEELGQLAQDFDKLQWKYSPVVFAFGDRRDLEPFRILPFVDRQLITDKGGTANVYEVAIPESFVSKSLRQSTPTSMPHPDFPEVGLCCHFALKVFRDGHKHLFDDETNAYRTVQQNNGMVKCLGDFNHADGNSTTHNILLEYAENDLAEHFFRSSPVMPDEIETFWKDLFRVPSTIQELHEFEKKSLSANSSQKYKGWHADIKPDNILFVRNEFKLADPGFARFQKQQDDRNTQGRTIESTGGTTTYGAPERFSSSSKTSDPSQSDMWSFGCVLSEAATWVVLGRSGVAMFSHFRRSAITRLSKGSRKADFFHDGTNVLPEIAEWHAYLKSVLRPTDSVTPRILDMIDKRLLRNPPAERFRARELVKWWLHELTELKNTRVETPRLSKYLDEAIKHAQSQEAEELQVMLDSQSQEDRKAAKSSNVFLQVPGLTKSTVPAGVRRSSIDGLQETGFPFTSNGRTQTTAQGVIFNTEILGTPSPSRESGILVQQQAEKSRVSIFDAHYSQLGDQLSSFIKFLSRQKARRDSILAKHIVNRDLVFLVDNAHSMLVHWSEVTFVLDILANKAIDVDKDGLDLMFTNGSVEVVNRETRKEIRQFKVAMASEEARPVPNVPTDMGMKLEKIFNKWLDKFGKYKSRCKDMTIIVLTDGKWEGMTDPSGVEKQIKKFNDSLRQKQPDFPLTRPVSIQFISFGDDPDALYRLRRLDNELGYHGIPDIVDTEPSSGDIYQMLLGSINDIYDQKNDPPPSSPPFQGQPGREDSVTSLITRATSSGTNFSNDDSHQRAGSGSSVGRYERSIDLRASPTTPMLYRTLHD